MQYFLLHVIFVKCQHCVRYDKLLLCQITIFGAFVRNSQWLLERIILYWGFPNAKPILYTVYVK